MLGYDDGGHYGAADALLSGRLPYRDFLLRHPPGIALALSPFAAIGRLTSDPTGMALARLACMAVGALNAAVRRAGGVPAGVRGRERPPLLVETTTLVHRPPRWLGGDGRPLRGVLGHPRRWIYRRVTAGSGATKRIGRTATSNTG